MNGEKQGRGGRGQPTPRPSAPALPVPTTEFDFDEGLSKFDKQKLKQVPGDLTPWLHRLSSLYVCLSSRLCCPGTVQVWSLQIAGHPELDMRDLQEEPSLAQLSVKENGTADAAHEDEDDSFFDSLTSGGGDR